MYIKAFVCIITHTYDQKYNKNNQYLCSCFKFILILTHSRHHEMTFISWYLIKVRPDSKPNELSIISVFVLCHRTVFRSLIFLEEKLSFLMYYTSKRDVILFFFVLRIWRSTFTFKPHQKYHQSLRIVIYMPALT